MIRAEIVKFNRHLLQNLKKAGIRLEDYRYCELFEDYLELSETEQNRKVVFLTLSQRYGITDRQVYNIVNHLKATI